MINVKVSYNKILNYITFSNNSPFVYDFKIHNELDEEIKEIELLVCFEGELAEIWKRDHIQILGNQSISFDFEKTPIRFNGRYLRSINEGYMTYFEVIVKFEQEILFSNKYDIQILANNQWMGLHNQPMLISAFLMPNHPKVTSVIKRASETLKQWGLAFTDYQTQEKSDIKSQMKAIYLSLQKEEINYVTAPPSFEETGQRLRLSDEVLNNKMGNCIELSLLFASCMEHVGINALLIFIHGHAFVGGWLEDKMMASAINDDISALNKRLARGIEELEIWEATSITSLSNVTYEESIIQGNEHLIDEKNFEYVLDVKKTRLLGVRPLPQDIDIQKAQTYVSDLHDEVSMIEAMKPDKVEELEDVELSTRRKRTRIQVWESKLLNLTLRNNLLNFRPHRRSISIMEGNLDELEDNLSTGKEFSLVPCPLEMDIENRKNKEYSYTRISRDTYRTYMNQELKNQRLVTLMNERELDYAIKALYYTSRTELEENGANTLFLAIGFLKWYESDISKLARFAPILLCPIELVRKSSVKGYVIRFRDEEIQINTTLLEKLRIDLNIEIPSLDTLPEDEHGIDVAKILNIIRTAIMNKANWDVVDMSYIGLFSFSEFVMWNDLHTRSEEIIKNKIVSDLINGQFKGEGKEIIQTNDIDMNDYFNESAILMDADSSQLSAIYSSAQGNSFVLHGPPGTGKSQTITNIIATALYQGKSVLFVAEKMAALNVVQNRLQKVGLGDFALELHSNKARKSEILSRLGHTLDQKNMGSVKDIQGKRNILVNIMDKLKESNEALHNTLSYGYSVFDLISQQEELKTYCTYPVTEQVLQKVSPTYIDQLDEMCKQFILAHKSLQNHVNHPLQRIKIYSLSIKERVELLKLLQEYDTLLMAFKESMIKTPVNNVGLDTPVMEVVEVLNFLNTILSCNTIFKYFIHNHNKNKDDMSISEIIHKARRRKEIVGFLEKDFNQSIFDMDSIRLYLEWQQVTNKWFLPKKLGQRNIIKSISLYANEPKNINQNTIENTLLLLKEESELKKIIHEYMQVHGSKYEELWQGELTDWDSFEIAVEQTNTFVKSMVLLTSKIPWFSFNDLEKDITNNMELYKQKNAKLVIECLEKYEKLSHCTSNLDSKINNTIFNDNNSIRDEIAYIQGTLNHYNEIDQWIEYNASKHAFYQEQLELFVNKVEIKEIHPSMLYGTIKKSLFYYLSLDEFDKNETLKEFKSSSMELLIEKYKQELQLVTEMTKLELIEKLIGNIPHPLGAINDNSELGFLKKAIKNGGRKISLRKIFDRTANVIRRIAPCMLMSPMSIAQYIDPSFPEFDLVIFDEASQVYTHTAVGAIARGKQLIVVGDPKQLPPTSFFRGSFDEDEEEFEEIDQDSILDECQTISFPELHLDWHYRSRHESLIAFSNAQYYENRLYTFPSYNDNESKVKLVPVEGFYDRGITKENKAEAKMIIEEIKRRLSDSELRKHSVGVVTFSSVQQRLIQNMLDELFQKYPQLEEISKDMKEELFIKNLENVQGDERDVILFSIGYGPDQNGKVTMNFGPLNQSEGQNRLNVVVSRSREEMVIYSTMKPEDIDLSRTSSQGVRDLKHFLEFARNRNALTIEYDKINENIDSVVESIANALEIKGYKLNKYIGKSNYKISIGILNDQENAGYLAAISVDGYNYKKTPIVRDRVIVQPSVLNSLGWNIINVSTIDWFKNQQVVIENIEKQLQEIVNRNERKENQDKDAKLELVEIEFVEKNEENIIYYKRYNLIENQFSKESFYTDDCHDTIIDIMNTIIKFEAPIVEEDLFRRILTAWGITQIGSRIRYILEELSKRVNAYKLIDDHQSVYWLDEKHHEDYKDSRLYLDDKRPFKYISDDEVSNTIIKVLKEQVSLDFMNLCREVFKLHGYILLGEESQNTVMRCLSILEYNNKIIVENDRYIIA